MTMLGPILPVQLLQQSNICPSSVFHIRRTHQTSPQVISRLWTTQRGDGKQVFQVGRRGAAGGARVAALSAKILPKRWNTCMEGNGAYVEKLCHCVPYVFNKLRDKKYLKFSFDSPSYFHLFSCLNG
jgi:hypothetical protein